MGPVDMVGAWAELAASCGPGRDRPEHAGLVGEGGDVADALAAGDHHHHIGQHPTRIIRQVLYVDVRRRTIWCMTTFTVTEARAALPELLTRVEGGEEVTITRHGRAIAVLVAPGALRSRRASDVLDSAQELRQLLVDARTRPLAAATMTTERADELVAEIRADRDAR